MCATSKPGDNQSRTNVLANTTIKQTRSRASVEEDRGRICRLIPVPGQVGGCELPLQEALVDCAPLEVAVGTVLQPDKVAMLRA